MATLKVISHPAEEGVFKSSEKKTESFYTPAETFQKMISSDSDTAIKTATTLDNFGNGIAGLTNYKYHYAEVTHTTSSMTILAE